MQPLLRLSISILVATTVSLAGSLKNRHPAQVSPIPIPKEASSLFLASNHFYVGIAAGRGSLANSVTKEKLSSNTGTLTVGYELNRYLSLEARYTRSFKDISYKSGNLNIPNQDIDSTFTNIALYTKVGYAFKDIKPYILLGYSQSKITNLSYADRKENSLSYAVGISYKASQNIELFIDYLRAYDDKGFDGRSRLDTLSLDIATFGINYHF